MQKLIPIDTANGTFTCEHYTNYPATCPDTHEPYVLLIIAHGGGGYPYTAADLSDQPTPLDTLLPDTEALYLRASPSTFYRVI